jgi:hypothetical protein
MALKQKNSKAMQRRSTVGIRSVSHGSSQGIAVHLDAMDVVNHAVASAREIAIDPVRGIRWDLRGLLEPYRTRCERSLV